MKTYILFPHKSLLSLQDAGAGLLAAAMIAVVPGYISRSVAGSYDNEGMHVMSIMHYVHKTHI